MLATVCIVEPVQAHLCGPQKVTVPVGGAVDWVITADLTEVETLYTPDKSGDPSIATLVPNKPFLAHNGEFQIQGVAKGETFIAIHWFYKPTGASNDCFISVTVESAPECTSDSQCDDDNLCTEDVCDPSSGTCSNDSSVPSGFCCNPSDGTLTSIDDGDPCTDDVCDESNGEVGHPPAQDGTACQGDGDRCTDDLCVDGACTHPDNDLCGVCCFGGGSCGNRVSESTCLLLNGVPLGADAFCTAQEACCLPGGECLELDPLCCEHFGGTPLGPETLCAKVPKGCCVPLDLDLDGDGFSLCCGDCNDNNPDIHVGAIELCNQIDDDCDGLVDEPFDRDRDGFTTCGGDCDDENPNVHPDAEETCNGLDDNCDGVIDEGFDEDEDGFTLCGGDCNDADPSVHAGAEEGCDGIDNNCDGQVDESCDRDRDGYSAFIDDCDDTNPAIHPNAVEFCDNNIDDDCDGLIDLADRDCAVPHELCDGRDNDGDGLIDEGFTILGVNQKTFEIDALPLGALCVTGEGECEVGGVVACSPDGRSVVCNATPGKPVVEGPTGDETCFDGLDNDCDGLEDHEDPDCTESEKCDTFDNDNDGLIDEDFAGLSGLCLEGLGICQKAGFVVCDESGSGTVCSATPGEPGIESPPGSRNCRDGRDNDCDGLTDSEDPDCRQGEICDGLDNDYDWCIDEDFPELGQPCAVGLGQCLREGVYVCSANQLETECSATPGTPDPEGPSGCTCFDLIDNDCDGLTDADDPDCFSARIADTVSCSLRPRRARMSNRCSGLFEINFKSTRKGVVVSGELLAVDLHGNITDSTPVNDGDLAFLLSSTTPLGDRIPAVGTLGRGSRSIHWAIAPTPLLRVTVDDGFNRGHAFCSNIPNLMVMEPNQLVLSQSEGDQTPLTVAIPMVDPTSLSLKVDGVDVLAELGIDPATDFPGGPFNGRFTITSHGLTPTREVEVCGLTVRSGPEGKPSAYTMTAQLNNLGCGGHIFVVDGEAKPDSRPPDPVETCHLDDIRDVGISQGLGVFIVSPAAGEVTPEGAVHVEGLACHGREITRLRIAGNETFFDVLELIPGDGENSADTWRLPIHLNLQVNDLRAELDTGKGIPGQVDPAVNRLVFQASDGDFHTTFDNVIFSAGPILPTPVVPDFAQGAAQTIASAAAIQVDKAFTMTMDAQAMSTFFQEVCDTVGPRLAQRIEDRLRNFVSRRQRLNLPSPFCNPGVSLAITDIDLDASQFTCSFTPEQGRIRMQFTLPAFSAGARISGGCKKKILGICLIKLRINTQATWRISGIVINFDITEESIMNERLDLNFSFGGDPIVIEATIQDHTRVGCILGLLFRLIDFIARVLGLWDRAQIDLRFELAGEELNERIGELDGDLRDLTLFRFDHRELVPRFMLQITRRLSEVRITPDYIAAAVSAAFEPTARDPDVAQTPGTFLTPAPLPIPPIAGADEVTVAISDDAFNRLLGGMTRAGKLKTLFEDVRELRDFLPDPIDCASLGPVRGPRCVGLAGGDCGQFTDFLQRRRCEAARNRLRRKNLGPDTKIILHGRVDVPPKFLIDDKPETEAIDVVLRYSQISVSIIADRDGDGVVQGDLNSLLPCFGTHKATVPECVLWEACLNVNVFARMSLQEDRLALKMEVTDVAHDLSTGTICRGGIEDESDALILEAARGQTLDLLNRSLRERTPDLERTGLRFGGLVEFENPRLIVIENDGDPDFADYIAITGRLVVTPPR